jgi:hypothetical protein
MKRILFLFLFCLLIYPISYSQVLKGKITNESGQAIQYATVYIQELKQGTTANTKGDYEIKLPAGKYLVTYQSLGYSPVFYNVTISDQIIVKNVVLPFQYYQIPEVRITATGEDPAYGIMRKAIGMAPYYLNNVNYYKAEVYLKGNLVINKIPKVIQKVIERETKKEPEYGGNPIKIKEGDVFLMESFNEIEFTAPDKYVQKVISVNSTFPGTEENISPMSIIEASFYQPIIADIAISPLSPQAFSYYNFKYQGATPQGNNIINKIQVTPKMKSQQLFEGTIYIIEDLWCLQSVDLTNENMAGKISVQQLYIPVQDDIWMPVSHKFVMIVGIMGIKADAGYGSSVKYLEVKPNTTLHKPESVTSDYYAMKKQPQADQEISASKNQKKIEEILKKNELDNRDMLKLSKLMDKESKNSMPDSVRKSLEIKDTHTSTIEKDANKKDSTYWAEVRPIPLLDVEMNSIRLRDSVKQEISLIKSKTDTVPKGGKKEKSKFARTLNEIAFGHTWSDTTGFYFNFGGLVDQRNISFNPVDGFVYGLDFRVSKTWNKKNTLTFAPNAKWAFSRQKPMLRLTTTYSFNKMKQMQLFVNAGTTSRDISNGGSINPLLNSISSLFFKKNYLKLYESRYLTFGYRTEITNGLNLEISAGYDDRRVLENSTNFAILNSSRKYSDNIPDNSYLDSTSNPIYALHNQKHFQFVTNVTYTPRQRYRIYSGTKVNRGSDWPTFTLSWRHGLNEFPDSVGGNKHFDMIRFEVSKMHNIGAFTEFRWRVRAGGLINKNSLSYYDFFHFNSQPIPILLDDYQDAFRLPAYYSLSTPEFFGEAHIKYTTPYLLLKYLPGLSKTLMRENLSLSYLGSKFHNNYYEIGYSITEIFLFGELGVYVGFEDLKYKSVGIRVVLKLG